tara:strand:+ start:1212 stop:2987 length:1776 start_codon:yes stop_codon:yes gene_type:complete
MPQDIKKVLKNYKNNLIRKNDLLVEYPQNPDKQWKTKVKGLDTDDAGNAAGRADYLGSQIKKNLRNLGFDVDDLDKQKTVAQLEVAPFGFRYSLFWPKKNEWGEEGAVENLNGKPISNPTKTRAKVINPNSNGGLIIETKEGLQIYFFDEKELSRTLGGGEGKLPPGKKGENYKRLLEEGITYKVKIDEPIELDWSGKEFEDNEKGEKESEGESNEEITVPESISSGKNRNEIFRLLLSNFAGFKGDVVYGDGFKDIKDAREYSKIRGKVKKGELDKSAIKDFLSKSSRDSYSMMVSNLRKSYPNTFFKKLSKAFPEFNVKYTKTSVDESLGGTTLMEEENVDKMKRWSLVFDKSVLTTKNIDTLDKNIKRFMATVKKWFSVPVKGSDGKKRSYNISYDEDKVNDYYNKFYENKNESYTSIGNLLGEIIKEEGEEVKPNYINLKIEAGGLETQDEGTDEVESRTRRKGKKSGGFIDAVIIDVGKKFDGSGKLSGGPFKIKPGFANKQTVASKEGSDVDLNIEYDGDGNIIKGNINITNNPEGINDLLNQVISSGKMKVKKSDKDNDLIILSYPSQTSVSDRINNTWQAILK